MAKDEVKPLADEQTAENDSTNNKTNNDEQTVESVDDEAEQPSESTVKAIEPTIAGTDSKQWEDNAKIAKKEHKEKFGRLKDLFRGYWVRKKWTIPLTILVLLIVVLAIPFTRYPLLGLFVTNQTRVVVMDSKTQKPVSGAVVKLGTGRVLTNANGVALVTSKVGKQSLQIEKNYYQTSTVSVLVSWPAKLEKPISFVPTGRQVPVSVTDKISGKPLANVTIRAAGTEARTDKNGKALVVLPTAKPTQDATILLDGYNQAKVSVQVTDQQVSANNFTLTSTGKLYFLSNQSGKIDVVKTDLDGANRQTIFAGTGSEDTQTTSLLASRDWKYLVLLAKHGSDSQSLYLINTSNDSVTNIDGGNPSATFQLVGWSNDSFVYQVNHAGVANWQSGSQVLKSYDASASKLYSIDQSQGEGSSASDYGFTSFSSIYLQANEIVYVKNWYSSNFPNHLTGKSVTLTSVRADGSNKHSVKDFPIPDGAQYAYYVNLAPYEPAGIYVQVPNNDGTNSYYEYEDGKISAKSDVTDDIFAKQYPTYLQSPSGKQVFWADVRDNKNTLFIGNEDAQNAKQIATLSDYTPYGWYSDNYLLVSKGGSELYIMAADGSGKVRKVTDYYKPQVTYRGYGGGYGGL